METETVVSDMVKEEFSDEEHGNFLRSRVWSIHCEADFWDVTFVVEEKEFPVHKLIMAASSDYFTTMFKGHFKEENNNKIPLVDVEASAFEQIIAYAYIAITVWPTST